MSLMVSQPKIEIPAVTKATAAFDPPVVRPGEEAFLRVVFNALEESIEWPTNLAGPPQLEIRPGAHGQILQMTGTSMEPRTAFNYRVRASSPGSFTVPEFVVKVDGKPVTVPAAQLEVVSEPPPHRAARGAAHARTARHQPVRRPGRPGAHRPAGTPAGVVQGLGQPQLSGPGILVDLGAARQRIEMMPRGGGQRGHLHLRNHPHAGDGGQARRLRARLHRGQPLLRPDRRSLARRPFPAVRPNTRCSNRSRSS